MKKIKIKTKFSRMIGDSQFYYIVLPTIVIGGEKMKHHIECSFSFFLAQWGFYLTFHIDKK